MARIAPVILGRHSFGTDEFIDELKSLSPGNLRALWLPSTNDATSNILKPDGRVWTYGNPGGLISNGDFETNTTGWGTNGTNTLARSTEQARFGTSSAKVTYADSSFLLNSSPAITITAAAHTLSAYVYIPANYDGTQPRLEMDELASATGTVAVDLDLTKRDQWQRASITFTPDAGDVVGRAAIYERGTAPTAGRSLYVDGFRLELGSSATAFGANISYQGNGILVSFNGTDQYITTPDTDDLSFGDGSNDSPLSIVALANVTNTAAARPLWSKWVGSGWETLFQITTSDALQFFTCDASASAFPNVVTDAAITQGVVGLYGVSYSGVGGATNMNGATLYVNGAAPAVTRNNSGTYVAMENGAGVPTFGRDPASATYMQGSLGFGVIYAASLTASQHRRIADLCREYYGVKL